jgi:transposase-like protein
MVDMITKVRKGREFSLKEQEQIVMASLMPGCKLADLLRMHGVARSTFYAWRKQHLATNSASAAAIASDSASRTPETVAAFVEVCLAPPERRVLTKASLQCGDLTVSLEGMFCSAQLVSILSALEASC